MQSKEQYPGQVKPQQLACFSLNSIDKTAKTVTAVKDPCIHTAKCLTMIIGQSRSILWDLNSTPKPQFCGHIQTSSNLKEQKGFDNRSETSGDPIGSLKSLNQSCCSNYYPIHPSSNSPLSVLSLPPSHQLVSKLTLPLPASGGGFDCATSPKSGCWFVAQSLEAYSFSPEAGL